MPTNHRRDNRERSGLGQSGQGEKAQLYKGFSDSFGRAIELACTPVLFGAAGWWLDHVLGLFPVFTIVLVVLCLVGMIARMYYAYEAQMQAQEAGAVWATNAGRGAWTEKAGSGAWAKKAVGS